MISAFILVDVRHEAQKIDVEFMRWLTINKIAFSIVFTKSDKLKKDEKTKLMCLSGVKQYPMRVKCATLSWHTLTSAMNNTQEEINTEKFD